MYATYEFYLNEYLMGKKPIVEKDLFPYYCNKASQFINLKTYGNIIEKTKEIEMCTCELVEYFYKEEKEQVDSNISSEKVGSYSVSYTSASEQVQKKDITLNNIVKTWLANTGLMYRGI